MLIPFHNPYGWNQPTYVGGTSNGYSGTTSTFTVSLTGLTGGIASAPVAGDIVIVITGNVDTTDNNPGVVTSGYTELAELFANDTRRSNLSVNWKIMGGTPDTEVVCTTAANTAKDANVTIVHVWRSVNQSSPIDVTTTTATGTNSALPDAPSITPVSDLCVILACGLGTTDATPTVDFTSPTGMANHVVKGVAPSDTGNNTGVMAAIASYSAWTTGAYDPAAWTGGESSTSDSWCAATIVLRPA